MESRDTPCQSADENSSPTIANSSPATSVFSKGHTSKSSASSLSIGSSPNVRDSLDFFGPRLGKVAEEQEKDEPIQHQDGAHSPSSHVSPCHIDDVDPSEYAAPSDYTLYFGSESPPSPTGLGIQADYSLGKHTNLSAMPLDHFTSKRQRSGEDGASKLHRRFSSRFGSMSRRLRNRSESGFQLSIITHMSAPPSRAGSISSAQLVSPTMSAISKHESYLPPSPAQEAMADSLHGSFPELEEDEEMQDAPPGDQPVATTPLLPPAFVGHLHEDTPVQSPLQSPSIAATPAVLSSHASPIVEPTVAGLPSPPLSTKQSLVSIQQRSRANTAAAPMAEIPPLQLTGTDPWSQILGHANFSIRPEPYMPAAITAESYEEFQEDWRKARGSYAKHLAQTSEHYGPTSKVFKLTVEKWTFIDRSWKAYQTELENLIDLQIKEVKRISDQSQDHQNPALEKPAPCAPIPEIDYICGKFPELGDGDMVAPMEVAPARAASMSPHGIHSRKRSLFRFLQDMFGKT